MGGGAVAGNLQQQQMQGLMNMLMGQTPTVQNKIDAAKAGVTGELGSSGILDGLFGMFGGSSGKATGLIPGDWNSTLGNFNPL